MADNKPAPTGFKIVKLRSKTGHYMILAWVLIVLAIACVGFLMRAAVRLVDAMFKPIPPDPLGLVKFQLKEAKDIEKLNP